MQNIERDRQVRKKLAQVSKRKISTTTTSPKIPNWKFQSRHFMENMKFKGTLAFSFIDKIDRQS